MPFGESSQDPNLPPHSQVVDVYLDWDKNPHVQPLKDIKIFFLGLQNSSISFIGVTNFVSENLEFCSCYR